MNDLCNDGGFSSSQVEMVLKENTDKNKVRTNIVWKSCFLTGIHFSEIQFFLQIHVLYTETFVLYTETFVLNTQTYVLYNETYVPYNKTYVLYIETFVLYTQTYVIYTQIQRTNVSISL